MKGIAPIVIVLSLLLSLRCTIGLRFVIDREECLSHSVPYEGDTVHVSFVVIKADSPWHFGDEGVDLVVCLLRLSQNLTFWFDWLLFNSLC